MLINTVFLFSQTRKGFGEKNINLREQTSLNSKVKNVIPQNTFFEVDSLGTDWSKVIFNNETGYVKSELIKFESNTSKNQKRNIIIEIIIGVVFFFISKIVHSKSSENKTLENLLAFLIIPISFIIISYIYNPENAVSLVIFSIISFFVALPSGSHKYTRSDGKTKDNRYKNNPYIDTTSEMSSFCWKTLVITIIYLIFILKK